MQMLNLVAEIIRAVTALLALVFLVIQTVNRRS